MILLFLLFILALDARADYNETIDDHDGRIQPNGRWLRQSVAAGDNYPYLAWNTNNSSSHTEIAGVSASLDFKGELHAGHFNDFIETNTQVLQSSSKESSESQEPISQSD
jgi:hypothetical protein